MKDWLRRVMEGRHGSDQLGQVLLFTGLVLSLISGQAGWSRWLILPAYAALAISLFRMLSRNHTARRKENEVWLELWGGLRASAKGTVARVKQSGQYHFYQCPKCGQRLRVPRGKGKLEILCPKCKAQFTKNT